jgi:hypothetical protein
MFNNFASGNCFSFGYNKNRMQRNGLRYWGSVAFGSCVSVYSSLYFAAKPDWQLDEKVNPFVSFAKMFKSYGLAYQRRRQFWR